MTIIEKVNNVVPVHYTMVMLGFLISVHRVYDSSVTFLCWFLMRNIKILRSNSPKVLGYLSKVYNTPFGLILLYRSPAAQQPYPSALVSSSTLTDRGVRGAPPPGLGHGL